MIWENTWYPNIHTLLLMPNDVKPWKWHYKGISQSINGQPVKQNAQYDPPTCALVDDSGKWVAILWLIQALLCANLEQTPIDEDQVEYNRVKVHSCTELFNGK